MNPIAAPIVSPVPGVHQSRFGFHPISKEQSKKLRFLNGVYQKALGRAAAWKRWYAKAPHNRVIKQRVRDANGQVVGYKDPVPWNEPAVCPIFSSLKTTKTLYHPTLGYHKDGIDLTEVTTIDLDIPACARSARMPAPTQEAVKKLSLTPSQIDAIHADAVAWLEGLKKK